MANLLGQPGAAAAPSETFLQRIKRLVVAKNVAADPSANLRAISLAVMNQLKKPTGKDVLKEVVEGLDAAKIGDDFLDAAFILSALQ